MYSDALDLYYRRKVAEWNYNTDIAKAREKGQKASERKGEKRKELELIINFFRLGIPVEKIAAGVKLPLSDVLSIISSGVGQ
jgi:hypothetical protein